MLLCFRLINQTGSPKHAATEANLDENLSDNKGDNIQPDAKRNGNANIDAELPTPTGPQPLQPTPSPGEPMLQEGAELKRLKSAENKQILEQQQEKQSPVMGEGVDPKLQLLDSQLRNILLKANREESQASSSGSDKLKKPQAADSPLVAADGKTPEAKPDVDVINGNIQAEHPLDPLSRSRLVQVDQVDEHDGDEDEEERKRERSGPSAGRWHVEDHIVGARDATQGYNVHMHRQVSHGANEDEDEEEHVLVVEMTRKDDKTERDRTFGAIGRGASSVMFGGVEERSFTTNAYFDDVATRAAPYTLASQFQTSLAGSSDEEDETEEGVCPGGDKAPGGGEVGIARAHSMTSIQPQAQGSPYSERRRSANITRTILMNEQECDKSKQDVSEDRQYTASSGHVHREILSRGNIASRKELDFSASSRKELDMPSHTDFQTGSRKESDMSSRKESDFQAGSHKELDFPISSHKELDFTTGSRKELDMSSQRESDMPSRKELDISSRKESDYASGLPFRDEDKTPVEEGGSSGAVTPGTTSKKDLFRPIKSIIDAEIPKPKFSTKSPSSPAKLSSLPKPSASPLKAFKPEYREYKEHKQDKERKEHSEGKEQKEIKEQKVDKDYKESPLTSPKAHVLSNGPSPLHAPGPVSGTTPSSEVDADPEPSSSSRHAGRSPQRRVLRQRGQRRANRPVAEESSGSDTEPRPNHLLDHAAVHSKLLHIAGDADQEEKRGTADGQSPRPFMEEEDDKDKDSASPIISVPYSTEKHKVAVHVISNDFDIVTPPLPWPADSHKLIRYTDHGNHSSNISTPSPGVVNGSATDLSKKPSSDSAKKPAVPEYKRPQCLPLELHDQSSSSSSSENIRPQGGVRSLSARSAGQKQAPGAVESSPAHPSVHASVDVLMYEQQESVNRMPRPPSGRRPNKGMVASAVR